MTSHKKQWKVHQTDFVNGSLRQCEHYFMYTSQIPGMTQNMNLHLHSFQVPVESRNSKTSATMENLFLKAGHCSAGPSPVGRNLLSHTLTVTPSITSCAYKAQGMLSQLCFQSIRVAAFFKVKCKCRLITGLAATQSTSGIWSMLLTRL